MTICKFIKDEKQTSPNPFTRKLYGQYKIILRYRYVHHEYGTFRAERV